MTEQENDEWWNRPDTPKKETPTEEELIVTIEKMKIAKEAIPSGLGFLQVVALIFIATNIVIMYLSLTKSYSLMVAIYAVPSTMILLHYILLIRQLKQILRGER